MTCLIIGATSNVGRHVVAELVQKGMQPRCMLRWTKRAGELPAGVDICLGDLDAPRFLANAFSGIERLFLTTAAGPNETRQGLAAIELAKSAGVKYVVYISVPRRAGFEDIPHWQSKLPIEDAIRCSGMEYTILRPNNYFQNDEWAQTSVMAYGMYPQPIGDIGLNRVDARDVATAAVNALTLGTFSGVDLELHGGDTLTGASVAEAYSAALGRHVTYLGNDLERWSNQAQLMMPEPLVMSLRKMYDALQRFGMKATVSQLEAQQILLRRPPILFTTYVAETVRQWDQLLAAEH